MDWISHSMWTNVVIRRALMWFAIAGALIVALHRWIPEVRTPVASGLLAVTMLLLVARPIARETAFRLVQVRIGAAEEMAQSMPHDAGPALQRRDV